ncbi:MAG: acyloxyacyl hydrolase [Urechidicola sp.]|nr:acyloxyacyl hydrolase [Urechidicola sp.]
MKCNFLLLIIFLLSFNFSTYAQEENSKLKIGFNYGFGETDKFPFETDDYTYDIQFYKIQLNYLIFEWRKFDFEINVEPSYYQTEHQLLNKYFVTPDDPDYLEKREEYTKLKTMNEYVLGIGFLIRYPIVDKLSVSALGSIGPMYIDTETERMAKGFAFSDVLSFGITYKVNKLAFDLRYGVRHVSNAELQQPNSGYNTTNLEFGVLIDL